MNDEERKQEAAPQMVSDFIREESRRGRLVSHQEIMEHLLKNGCAPVAGETTAEELESILQESIQGSDELKRLLDPGGNAHYYSTMAMTEPYAHILIGRKGNPLTLIAEIVRESSSAYPRPVPVESFKEPPFDMTEEEIRSCLERIAGQEDLQDIRPTTTSTGALFLFSTRHLAPDHAAMLAEWMDMGPLTNP